ncbi:MULTISPECIES: cytochrome b/b6 domain-containing protein [unclassified Synechococcus]|uniref:cytochrome b/b6 domain-containing protein n=1 Tax=unclassified Synechococcus TaxID=2626047 RepID=UPI0021A36C76|nr:MULTISPECIES: cytochrome b/b6 domain-containing protein [unclassified Synechococcus]MCT0214464.1 cytochrome b/b6 domain-containing protein [Synechococcus sp. CS-1326]MCT0233233.1 cytochrome b/b6 domain-containing protein [Synechococcus sp. CS-1327]
MDDTNATAPPRPAGIRHAPIWTRGFHSLNLLVLAVMAASGLQIYNANPVFGGRGGVNMPELFTLGGWLAGGRDWHFGFMGLYALNLGLWIALLMKLRHRKLADRADLSTLKASQNTGKRRLSAHRLTYTLMVILLAFGLITGLAMYKPAQFWWLAGLFSFGELFGATSWHTLRVAHFATVPAMVLLIAAHMVLSWRIGGLRLWRSMAL